MYDWSQKAEILEVLKSGRSLTQKQAINEFGVGRLAAVICYLRKNLGYDIETKTIAVEGKNGRTSHVAQYWLRSEEDG